MQRLGKSMKITLLVACSALFLVPAGVAAKNPSSNQAKTKAILTLKQVKQRLRQDKQYLKDARKRAKAGDAKGLNTALNNYDRSMNGLNTAIRQGQIQGSPWQQEDAYQRVQNATSKHLKELNKLLGKVPPQAVPHIQHAIDVSQMGQQTALSHLSQLQTQQRMNQGNRSRIGQPGAMGRPAGAGRGGAFGAGIPPMGAPNMGNGMNPPGDPGAVGNGPAGSHGHGR